MSSDALDGPTTKTFQAPNVTSSKVEKPSFEIIQPRDRIVCVMQVMLPKPEEFVTASLAFSSCSLIVSLSVYPSFSSLVLQSCVCVFYGLST